MDSMWKAYDLLLDKIGEIVEKGDISPAELDCLYKAYKTMYYMTCIDAMVNADDDYEVSRTNMSMARRSSRDYPYSNNSTRRRSSRTNGARNYSGHDRKEMLMQRIAEMQDELDRMGE